MEIIKDAFIEGRETEVEWDKSTAKSNSVKVDVALENFSMMKKRERHSLIPLHKICPDTGNILETFPSRIAACRHIVKDILKNPNKNPISVSGNMEMGMRAGWKSYGFYWKLADKSYAAKVNTGTITMYRKVFYRSGTKELIFASQKDAAKHFGVGVKKMRAWMNSKPNVNRDKLNGGILQEVNPKLVQLTFNSIKDAAKHANCSVYLMQKLLNETKVINNYQYNISNKIRSKTFKPTRGYELVAYDLFEGKVRIGSYQRVAELADKVGSSRQQVNKKMVMNKAIDKAKRYFVKPRYAKVT